MNTSKAESKSAVGEGKVFFSECVDELKKVNTPTRQETIQATIVAVVIIGFVAISLLLLDFVFNRIMGAMLS
jgi:preprotein translocase SecE subunit